MSVRFDSIRTSADKVRAAIDSGDRKAILLAARDHAVTLLQHSTSARDAPPLLKQVTDITAALEEIDSGQEADKFDALVAGIKW